MYEIYIITNDVNDLVYIGCTSMGLSERLRHHVKDKKSTISKAIREIGKEHFSISLIDTAETKEAAIQKEKTLTLQYKSNDPQYGYNIMAGYSNYGHPITEETRRKISEKQKGKPGLQGELNPNYGKRLSPETREKISNSLKGRFVGEKSPVYGKKQSLEARAKRSGPNHWTAKKSFTQETREKMSAAQRGAKSNNHRACMCIETGETFPYVKAVTEKYGLSDTHIHAVCKGQRKRCGKLHWKYIPDSEVIHNKE